MGWETEQSKLVQRLRREGAAGEVVLAVLARVPRDVFVDEAHRHLAFQDTALPIGHAQTISQPTVVAVMTEALQVEASQRVLEVGTGSAYQTAVLAELAGEGEVLSIERSPELANLAERRLHYLGYANVRVVVGDGTLGLPQHAPFDRILVTAAAPTVPPALIDQLAPGGRLVIPVGGRGDQRLVVVQRGDDGGLLEQSLGQVRFVPLVGAQGWPE
ncbi:MAG: protein-L-isoaspartate(D-aspartate) O-methyltransferase [Chloroflexota bacterium]|nr:protein-L-isoaspartate(D-aspartate) O-methyltransferase [Chloroflexota bacterium]